MPKSKEFVSTSDSDSDYEKPKAKKKKEDKKPEDKKPAKASSSSGGGGESRFQLAKMRFASVSEFKGKKYVNIREYYEQDGDLRPGRKGIALNQDQWKKLKDCMEDIDTALEEL